jgi:sterol desaturase/sphingolipid hydroxylase (fatty acid hydroxylase superfamily)
MAGAASILTHSLFSANLKSLFFYYCSAAVFGLALPYFNLKLFRRSQRRQPLRGAKLSFFAILIFNTSAVFFAALRIFFDYPRRIGLPSAFAFNTANISLEGRHTALADNVYLWTLYQILWAVFMFLVLDFSFYWGHRLLHSRTLYASIHSTHHEFTEPSAFAGYATSLREAVFLTVTFIIIPNLILPYNIYVEIFTSALQIIWVTFIHSGLDSSAWTRRPFLRYINSPSHHLFHHRKGEGNYALYFTFWDKLMGTENIDFANFGPGNLGSEPPYKPVANTRESTGR